MGDSYKIFCKNCTTKENLRNLEHKSYEDKNFKFLPYFKVEHGVGVFFCNKEQFLEDNIDGIKMIYSLINNEKINKQTEEKIIDGYIFSDTFGYRAYYCKKCSAIESHFSFFMKNENKIFIPKYMCMYCGKITRKIKIDWEIINDEIILFEKKDRIKLICPKCHQNNFDVGDLVRWD